MRSHREQPVEGARIGLFGLLGSGNIGNDASMEAVLRLPAGPAPLGGDRRHVLGPGKGDRGVRARRRPDVLVRPSPGSSLVETVEPLRVPSRILDVFRVLGLGAPARSGDRPRCRRSRGEPPAATVEHAVRTLPAHRLGQAVQDQGCPGLRRGRSDQEAGDPNPLELGSPIGQVPLLPRWRLP